MSKAFLDKAGDDFLSPPRVHDTRSEIVPAGDDLVTGNSTESNSLGITRFKPDRGTRGDVQSFSIGPGTIEGQTRVRFDEVIVRSDL